MSRRMDAGFNWNDFSWLRNLWPRTLLVKHPFGTLKMRMGATYFLTKRVPKVAAEMAMHVLAYNLTRVMNIMGIQPLIAQSGYNQS